MKMPTGNRRWNFEVQGKDILIIRENEEFSGLSGLRFGPIKLITKGKEHTRGAAAKQQALLVSNLARNYRSVVSRFIVRQKLDLQN